MSIACCGAAPIDRAASTSSPKTSRRACAAKVNVREVEGALRILASAGAYRRQPESGTRAHVRLLATPQRIKRELGGTADSMELGLLRAMWRVAGSALERRRVDRSRRTPAGIRRNAPASCHCSTHCKIDSSWSGSARAAGAALEHPQRELATFRHRLGRRSIGAVAPSSRSSTRCSSTRISKTCRRGFVLRYFGDPAARPKCAGCDNCLGTHVDTSTLRRRLTRTARAAAETLERERAKTTASTMTLVARRRRWRAARASSRTCAGRLPRRSKCRRTSCFPIARSPRWRFVVRERSTALAGIRGVGPTKLERYGERFSNVLRSADGTEAA